VLLVESCARRRRPGPRGAARARRVLHKPCTMGRGASAERARRDAAPCAHDASAAPHAPARCSARYGGGGPQSGRKGPAVPRARTCSTSISSSSRAGDPAPSRGCCRAGGGGWGGWRQRPGSAAGNARCSRRGAVPAGTSAEAKAARRAHACAQSNPHAICRRARGCDEPGQHRAARGRGVTALTPHSKG